MPVFEEMIGSDRPQTGIWWLRKKPGTGPRLLGQMARGEVDISHDTFRALPSDRAHDYLRDLLAAVGVLEPFDPRVERMTPWLEAFLSTVPPEHAAVISRYAHWHVLRNMRRASRQGRLTQTNANKKRRQIRAAAGLLAYLDEHGMTAETATQAVIEDYQRHLPYAALGPERTFINWLRTSRVNTGVHLPSPTRDDPEVTISDEHRWDLIERLLHDATLNLYTRVAGLLTLLFAQPLSRIVSMRTDQVDDAGDAVRITFATVPIQMPPLVDDLVREQLRRRGKSLYASRSAGWLFPGGAPGRHLSTENIRAQLTALGVRPSQARKAALFQLAADVPAPVLSELIGIHPAKATQWASLAARDWRDYIAARATQVEP